ncbi:MAG: ABC transporter ATP-binding protein [Myxococcales bacterium]|nr:ABC transporter ATP-binding protein [Myxococcales bacterium]
MNPGAHGQRASVTRKTIRATSCAVELAAASLGRAVPGERGPRWLYRDLSWTCERGTVTAVVGPNGAGKSTLLRDLAGLSDPAEGRVRLGDREIGARDPSERARLLAYLPQRTEVEHDWSVGELVMLGRAPHRGRFSAPDARDRERVDAALARVGLRALEGRGIRSLSGGELQRVMLARMLATEASVLVLDEPTTALDIGHALGFLALCRSLAADGATVVLAMHDLDRARRLADVAVLLAADDRGTAFVGPASEVLVPARLEPIFAVAVHDHGEHLTFALKPSQSV